MTMILSSASLTSAIDAGDAVAERAAVVVSLMSSTANELVKDVRLLLKTALLVDVNSVV